MGRTFLDPERKKSRNVSIRLTPGEYDWVVQEAAQESKRLGYKITVSGVATRCYLEGARLIEAGREKCTSPKERVAATGKRRSGS